MNLFCYCDDGIAVVKNLYKTATNMTDEIGYLTLLVKHNKVEDEIDHFYDKWETNNNVIDKWFATQAVHTNPKKSLEVVANLTKHFDFEIKNPNRFRSVIGAFAANNLPGFHQEDGKGYDLVTDWLIELDAINPQTTARVCTSFDNWKIFDEGRQRKIKQNLIKHQKNEPILSRERHISSLKNILVELKSVSYKDSYDIRAFKYREALRLSLEINQKFDIDNILDIIFKDFCIGK